MNQKGSPREAGQTQVLILAGIVIFIAVAGGVFFLGRVTAPKPQPPLSTSSPQPSPLSTEAPAKVEDPTANWKTYTSTLGYSFNYPPDWSLETRKLEKGKTLHDGKHYTITADTGDVELVRILKDKSWEIEVVAQKALTQDECGGQGPVNKEEEQNYRSLKVLDREAARLDLEKGQFWTGADQPEPYPQPIMFKRLPGELIKVWPKPDTENSFVYAWCLENKNKLMSLKLTYYSNEFTLSNIKGQKLESSKLAEMDQILSTFRFLP